MLETSEALDIFVKRYNELYVYAYTFLNNRQWAEDALQNVIVRVLEVQPSFQSEAHCIHYLYKSVKNSSINTKNKETRSIITDPEDFKDILTDNKQDASKRETLDWLQKAIAKYPPEIADAYVRKVLFYEPTKQLAKELDMKANTLTQYFRRIDAAARQYYTMFVDFVISMISRLTFLFLRLY